MAKQKQLDGDLLELTVVQTITYVQVASNLDHLDFPNIFLETVIGLQLAIGTRMIVAITIALPPTQVEVGGGFVAVILHLPT